jgi:hypothetical protein
VWRQGSQANPLPEAWLCYTVATTDGVKQAEDMKISKEN